MSTVSRRLPAQPHLDVPKRQARELLKQWRAALPEALDRIARQFPKSRKADHAKIAATTFRLSDAQLVVAREYGFSSWTQLKQRITASSLMIPLGAAIRADDRA